MKNCIWMITVFLLSINAYLPIVEAKNNEKPALGSRDGGTLFTDHFPARPAQAASAATGQIEQMQPLLAPLADTFLLHSYPSSQKVIYLDFDGHVGYWEDIYTPFDMDGDDTTTQMETSVNFNVE